MEIDAFIGQYTGKLAAFLDGQRQGAGAWTPDVLAAAFRFDVTTPLRLAMLLAQVGHESGWFTELEENLNYSADRLLQVFPSHFTSDEAAAYAHKPERIASRVYANRMGNGPETSGDGWTYRGRGPIQYTGEANYAVRGCLGRGEYATHAALQGKPLLDDPDLLLQPGPGMFWAGWFWDRHGLNAPADQGDVTAATRIINGGTNGLAHRQALYAAAMAALG